MKESIDVLVELLTRGSVFSKIRTVFGTLVMVMLAVQYLKIRSARKKITEEQERDTIEKIYEKNDDGLYPWEIDIDDSPKRIAEDAKKINNEWAPRRGRWS